ncbi:hypothetical protein [Catenuloplanes japonicus]|uniref:hypothetical protein n=1 Tax=Catenuloplanes japonicus TaxID=33876 RepID=UPI0012FCB035|nr:hypothetical protein [Catenuloplanes japonicus]
MAAPHTSAAPTSPQPAPAPAGAADASPAALSVPATGPAPVGPQAPARSAATPDRAPLGGAVSPPGLAGTAVPVPGPGPTSAPGPVLPSGVLRVKPATPFATFAETPTFAEPAAETTVAATVAPVREPPRPPAWRLWLVPLVLVGAIVVTTAALVNRSAEETGESVAVPPVWTLGPPATGAVTIVPPSPDAGSATPSAPVTASPSATPSPSASKSLAPTPSRAAAAAPVATTGGPAQSGPITGATACSSGGTAIFSAAFTVAFEWHHAFIDVDGNASTGYAVPDVGTRVGADYMVENDSVWRSADSEWAWDEVGRSGLQFTQNGSTFRWQVPASAIGSPGGSLRVVFNGAGGSPDANSAVLTTGSC